MTSRSNHRIASKVARTAAVNGAGLSTASDNVSRKVLVSSEILGEFVRRKADGGL